MRKFGLTPEPDAYITYVKCGAEVTACYYQKFPKWTSGGYVDAARWFVPAWNAKSDDFFSDPNEGDPVLDDDEHFGGTFATFDLEADLSAWMNKRGFTKAR